jgi:hypothetical protein
MGMRGEIYLLYSEQVYPRCCQYVNRAAVGGGGDLILGRAIDGLAVVLVYEEGAGEEAFGCGDDVEGVAGDVEGECQVVDVAVDDGLFDEEVGVAVVDVPLVG